MRLLSRQIAGCSVGFKYADRFRRTVTLLCAVTLLNMSAPLAPGAFASGGRDSQPTGVIRVAGTVTIDGTAGTTGQTIFPGSQITTHPGSESIIDLGKFTRLRLLADTELTLDFSGASLSSTLDKGVVRGFIPAGFPVNIRTAGGELFTDPGHPVEFIIQVAGENTKVSVTTGRVELRTQNKHRTVDAGEVFTTNAAAQDPEDKGGLKKAEKIGIFAAIGATVAILITGLRGRDKPEPPEPQFGDCVIIPSGEGPFICP